MPCQLSPSPPLPTLFPRSQPLQVPGRWRWKSGGAMAQVLNLNKNFFWVQCPPSHPSGACSLPGASATPTAGRRAGQVGGLHGSVHPPIPPPPWMNALPHTPSSQGKAFPASLQTQHQETSRKRLPSGLHGSGGRCRRRGKGEICHDSCSQGGSPPPRAVLTRPFMPVYSEGLGRGTRT